MTPQPHFSKNILATLHASKILGLRVGAEHRFIGVWFVMANDRLFVRPWNNKPDGRYQAFQEESNGTIQVNEREIKIRARKSRGERLMDTIDQAYREKYPTPGSHNYVVGFAQPRRRGTTLELMPI